MISTGPEEISVGQKFLLLQSTVSLTRSEEKMEGNSEKQAVQEVLGWNVTVTSEPVSKAWRSCPIVPLRRPTIEVPILVATILVQP